MEPQPPSTDRGHSSRWTLVATIVVIWALIDPIIGLVIIFLAAWLLPWVVFLAAVVILTAVNTALCSWLDRSWGPFIAGPGKRLESRLEKMRNGRVMRHPVRWITEGSSIGYSIAAMLTNAITCVGLARVIGGKPVGQLG